MLILRKPPHKYSWLGNIERPDRYLRTYMNMTHVMRLDCIIAGTKFIDMDREQVFGNPFPKRWGKLSFYYDRTGVYDRVKNDPDIFFYWERLPEHGEKKTIEPPVASYSHFGRGRPSHEAYHDWDEDEIRKQLIQMCEKVNSGIRLEEACMLHGISMWTFKQLFQLRYPGEYYEWTTNRKIPQKDNLAQTLAKRFPSMSGVG